MKYFALKLSENICKTPEGYLLCLGVSAGRIGNMIYAENETPLEAGPDGKVIVSRDEKELFRPETIASFEGKPLTIGHPQDFVTPENWKILAKGILQNARRGEGDQKDDLVFDVLVTDQMAIQLVENGLREVSCGYEADYIQDGPGKGKQINIVGNHLALVEQGRAGTSYAINDSINGNGKGAQAMKKKISERLKELFAKTEDEASKILDEDMPEEKKEEKSKDAGAYDELVKMVKDLGEKVSAMASSKGEKKEESKDDDKDKEKPVEEKKEEKAKDDEGASVEERLKTLEAAVQKLLDMYSEKSGDEEGEEESEDEDAEDDEESEATMVGDTAARAEILAPGIKITKDVKVKALKKAYESKEGKLVIDALAGGKLTFDSAEKVNTLFIAASEVLKASRTEELSNSKKNTRDSVTGNGTKAFMTPEKMNDIFAAKYKQN